MCLVNLYGMNALTLHASGFILVFVEENYVERNKMVKVKR
jgi:hypothetical protein